MSLILTVPQPTGSLDGYEEGTYTLQFTGYDVPLMEGCGYNEPNDPEVCKYERRTKFWFDIIEDGQNTGDKISEYVTLQVKYNGVNDPAGWKTVLGERAKLAKFLKAFNGGTAIAPGESIDLDSFVGKRIDAILEKNEKGYLRVTAPTAIRPPRRKQAATATAAVADDVDNPFADEA